jgi:hypothetical protein
MSSLQQANRHVYAETLQYFAGLAGSLTVAEASACLRELGHYDSDEIWFVKPPREPFDCGIDKVDAEGVWWAPTNLYRLPVKRLCNVGNIKMPITFHGGPPGDYAHHVGNLQTFICDRILRAITMKGKTTTSYTLTQTLSKMRRPVSRGWAV